MNPSIIPTPFIEDDFFHRQFDLCVGNDEIQISFCMYSITWPFYVEGMPSSGETTNIYGRVFPKYDIYSPCLQWITADHTETFPSMKYQCTTTSYPAEDSSQETLLFENEIHTFFLSFFEEEVYSTNILQTAYKGFSYDEDRKTAYVFYDFSPIHHLLKDVHTLVISEELKDEPIFAKYPFLRNIKGYPSPSLLYMCIYDAEKQDYVNVDVDMDPSKYGFPLEHPLLGCTAYYFTQAPLDPSLDVSKLVRFACIQSRIMYEVQIDTDGNIFYMGENVGEFKEDFEMGLLMCSTLHFEEKGCRFVAIKNWTHIERVSSKSNAYDDKRDKE